MDIKDIRRKNLAYMIDKVKKAGIYKTQEEIGIAMGFDDGSYLSQLKNGNRPIEPARARDFEKFFNLNPNAFETPMDEPVLKDGYMDRGILRPSPNYLSSLNETDGIDYVDTSEFVLIPQFDVKGACGLGYSNPDELIKGGLVFKESWLRKKGISPRFGRSAVMGGDGDSMLPTIDSSNILLANLDIKTYDQIQTGKVYAFVANKELRIKRLFKNLKNGGLRIVSDNPDKELYDDEYLTKEELDNIQIVAQLVWRGGDL